MGGEFSGAIGVDTHRNRLAMFDSKMVLIFLAIALVVFGTKRIRAIGSDLGAAMKGFKEAVSDGESEEIGQRDKQLPGKASETVKGAS
jgi:sec-independent protein translocase protein TatA